MNEIRLIVNADDFGMSRGITDGIIVAHRYGILTSTSLMPNMPAAIYAIKRVSNFPALALGVHLNICQGRPILPANAVRSLVGIDGTFHSPREMVRRLWMWQLAPGEVEREFRAQIRWVKERGIVPTHADSHHHLHLYAAAAAPFARALEAEGIHCARACRCVEWPKRHTIGGPYKGGLARRALVQMYRRTVQRTVFRALISPASRIAISYSTPGALRERWRATLESLPPGDFELACHPGLFEPGFSETDTIRARREEELGCLTDADLSKLIADRGIRLITYRDLQMAEQMERRPAEAVA
jgi:chitin disaccharide deacetylase